MKSIAKVVPTTTRGTAGPGLLPPPPAVEELVRLVAELLEGGQLTLDLLVDEVGGGFVVGGIGGRRDVVVVVLEGAAEELDDPQPAWRAPGAGPAGPPAAAIPKKARTMAKTAKAPKTGIAREPENPSGSAVMAKGVATAAKNPRRPTVE